MAQVCAKVRHSIYLSNECTLLNLSHWKHLHRNLLCFFIRQFRYIPDNRGRNRVGLLEPEGDFSPSSLTKFHVLFEHRLVVAVCLHGGSNPDSEVGRTIFRVRLTFAGGQQSHRETMFSSFAELCFLLALLRREKLMWFALHLCPTSGVVQWDGIRVGSLHLKILRIEVEGLKRTV